MLLLLTPRAVASCDKDIPERPSTDATAAAWAATTFRVRSPRSFRPSMVRATSARVDLTLNRLDKPYVRPYYYTCMVRTNGISQVSIGRVQAELSPGHG